MKKRVLLASFAALGMFAGSTYAADGAGPFVGVALGQATVNVEDIDFNELDSGFKLFGGYNFNKYVGLELGYLDGGSSKIEDVSASLEVSPSAFTVEGVGRIPLGEVAALYGKAGVAFYKADVDASLLGVTASESESGSELIYGVGFALNLGKNLEIRAEWEKLDFKIEDIDGDISVISIGGVYKF